MKRILSIGLLALLLYNMFGLAVGVFFFENDFQTASETQEADEYKVMKFPVAPLPYSNSWENTDDVAGLFQYEGKFYNVIHQKIENDTAYVTLKTNLSARERFLELADQITDVNHTKKETPMRKAIRSLSELAKVYWLSPHQTIVVFTDAAAKACSTYTGTNSTFISPLLALFGPPPEH
ncbi:hypothetical protein [Dyadobacter sp. OTU695]|uniref:hypothetical protein n=1 Tax=Dyadobacter sp. OTU695 TaxID=3043860 RepID=UPI00313BC2BC